MTLVLGHRLASVRIELIRKLTSARAPQLYLSSTSSLSPPTSAIHALTHSHLKIDIQDLGDRIMLTNVFISFFESVIMGC